MGSKKQTILTLNGRSYDALTGKPVEGRINAPGRRAISDVVAPRASRTQIAPPTPAPTETPKPPVTTNGPKVMDVSRSTRHIKPRSQQRAKTLVRSAVSKPKPGLKRQTKVSAPTKALSPHIATVAPKWSAGQINPKRLNRAEHVAKSEAITRFSEGSVVGTPTPQSIASVSTRAPAEAIDASQQPATDSHDLFEKAIAAAESHKQTYTDPKKSAKLARKQAKQTAKVSKTSKKPVHHHLASVVAASLAVLVIGGLFGLQNKDAITLRFADAKAGFNASLPTYQPEGYGVGSFSYAPGNVGTSFQNADTGREYTLNQQTTKWESEALLDNYVRVNYPSYQALQSGNQIIYVYGKNNASWIKNGIWYQLTSNGNLSTSQVLSIADSI